MSSSPYLVKPGSKVNLGRIDPDSTGSLGTKEAARAELDRLRERIDELQVRLYAERRQSLLIVLQATDTGGKDGAIKRVFKGVNAQGLRVHSFKQPTGEELEHDFLRRIHKATPGKGMIGVFNRSHYEDVLVVRVHGIAPKTVWSPRFAAINAFERTLSQHGTRIIKFFLHISKEEQKERLQARLDDPTKIWKFNSGDLDDRARWDDYQTAFQDALSKCSTELAPWYVIPSNRKWARDVAITQIVAQTLEEMNPQFPSPEEGLDSIVIPD
ncbi:MAG: polyphosphate kinase 2 family protein [Thermomicrobiales bacterium]